METWMIEIIKIIISLVITIAAVVIARYVIPKLKEEIGVEKFNTIAMYVDYAVRAAEQIYIDAGLGEKKKEYVLKFINDIVLKDGKYSITSDELNVLIESAVNAMNESKKLIETK